MGEDKRNVRHERTELLAHSCYPDTLNHFISCLPRTLESKARTTSKCASVPSHLERPKKKMSGLAFP